MRAIFLRAFLASSYLPFPMRNFGDSGTRNSETEETTFRTREKI
jgi:hypothetical protein